MRTYTYKEVEEVVNGLNEYITYYYRDNDTIATKIENIDGSFIIEADGIDITDKVYIYNKGNKDRYEDFAKELNIHGIIMAVYESTDNNLGCVVSKIIRYKGEKYIITSVNHTIIGID